MSVRYSTFTCFMMVYFLLICCWNRTVQIRKSCCKLKFRFLQIRSTCSTYVLIQVYLKFSKESTLVAYTVKWSRRRYSYEEGRGDGVGGGGAAVTEFAKEKGRVGFLFSPELQFSVAVSHSTIFLPLPYIDCSPPENKEIMPGLRNLNLSFGSLNQRI
jgi:hypothetical protein